MTSSYFYIQYKTTLGIYPKNLKFILFESNPSQFYYDSKIPEEKSTPWEHHLYLAAKPGTCLDIDIYKYLSQITKTHNTTPHIYLSTIKANNTYTALRLRENEISLAIELASVLEGKAGIKFLTNKPFKTQSATITYKKFIKLEELNTGIYKDTDSKHIYLFELPKLIDMEQLIQVARNVRNRHKFSCFEPFLSYMLTENFELKAFMMIYAPDCEENYTLELKKTISVEVQRLT